jgi:hypothetical protein
MPKKNDTPAPKRKAGRPRTDGLTLKQWAEIKERREAGISVSDLAEAYRVDADIIAKRAMRERWTISHAEAVRRVADVTAARLTGLEPAPGPEAATDPMAVAIEAKVAVVLRHRTLIGRLRGVVHDLMEITEHQVAAVREQIEGAPEGERGLQALTRLPVSSAITDKLSTLTKTTQQLVSMEREAFGISASDTGAREETYEERLKRLLEKAEAAK